MNISLPPGVSYCKEIIVDCQMYIFRHKELGELGRIVVQGLPNGQTHLSSEVAGDPGDPMTETRKSVFAPLSEQITDSIEALLGKGTLDDSTPL